MYYTVKQAGKPFYEYNTLFNENKCTKQFMQNKNGRCAPMLTVQLMKYIKIKIAPSNYIQKEFQSPSSAFLMQLDEQFISKKN